MENYNSHWPCTDVVRRVYSASVYLHHVILIITFHDNFKESTTYQKKSIFWIILINVDNFLYLNSLLLGDYSTSG
jgi:hypothetical protein